METKMEVPHRVRATYDWAERINTANGSVVQSAREIEINARLWCAEDSRQWPNACDCLDDDSVLIVDENGPVWRVSFCEAQDLGLVNYRCDRCNARVEWSYRLPEQRPIVLCEPCETIVRAELKQTRKMLLRGGQKG
jgi:hypothetical protein